MFHALSKKGIGILISLLIAIVLSLAFIPIAKATLCYVESSSQCIDYQEGSCANIGGIEDVSNTFCTIGCCCFKETGNTNGQGKSDITSKYCTDHYIGTFISADTFQDQTKKEYTSEQCTQICQQGINSTIEKPKTQCSDGIDNDGDGKIDSADSGCNTAAGVYDSTDNSEVDTDKICSPSSKSTAICDCIGKQCSAGQYCYDSADGYGKTCHDEAPKQCKTDDKLTVSFDKDGCQMVASCVNGVYQEPKKEPNCPKQLEDCTATTDLNNNGKVGCNDLACIGFKCSDNKKEDTTSANFQQLCSKKAKYSLESKAWQCCLNQAYDCDGDSTPESCEPCSCQSATNPAPPQISSIEQVTGKYELKINFNSFCKVQYSLMACKGAESDCAENKKIKLLATQWQQLDTKKEVTFFSHTSIASNTNYCYAIKALYPDKSVYSDVKCINSGNKLCLQSPYEKQTEFCLPTSKPTSKNPEITFNTEIYYCDDQNQLQAKGKSVLPGIEDQTTCKQKGPQYFCAGPNANKKADCIYQSACIFCGQPLNPFNMFADKTTSKLSNKDDIHNNELCSLIDVCYYDFTATTVDAFQECKDVNTCSDYKSQTACESKKSTKNIITTNNCLTRNCTWSPIADELNLGVCKEELPQFNKCSACESSQHNNIFDFCDANRCKGFSSDETKCYPHGSADDNRVCSEETEVDCSDYRTAQECTGDGENVKLDVTYTDGVRTAGTNKITHATTDWINIKTCFWDNKNKKCFKDADGDGLQDTNIRDITPPKTQLLTPEKTQKVNLQFALSDESPKGRDSTGIKATYYCYAKQTAPPCYPTELYDSTAAETILPIDQGLYTIYFYSEDNANNLEEVQSGTVDVDRQPPKITIDYKVIPDTSYPFTESSIFITVSLDEPATCTDNFESKQNQNKIDDDFGNLFQATYDQLQDSTYRYSITCQDKLGNKGTYSILMKVDADIMIQNTLPTNIIGKKEATLEITTMQDGDCTFGSNKFIDKQELDFGNTVAYKMTAPITLTTDQEYSFPIVCTINGKTYTDEVQFVLDTTPPTTAIVDISNLPFDTSKFYSAESLAEKIFLSCKDFPQSTAGFEIGFGCSHTNYCIDDKNQDCETNKLYNPIYSLDETFTNATTQWLCYNSSENIINQQGGLQEKKQCIKLNQDVSDPEIDVQYLAAYEEAKGGAVKPLQVYGSEYTLLITVTDKDALTTPPSSNYVTITVNSLAATTSQILLTKENLKADSPVVQIIPLVKGVNQIVITAKDRSNKMTTKTYYIEQTQITEELIQLTSPENGVSNNSNYQLAIKLKENVPAESCVFSYSENFGGSYSFDKFSSTVFQKQIITPESEEGIPKAVYVKCKLEGSIEAKAGFIIVYDNTKPIIKSITLEPSNNNFPAAIVQPPIRANITVITDDKTHCRIMDKNTFAYANMRKFDNYDTTPLSIINKQEISDQIENPMDILRIQDKSSYTYTIQCYNGRDLDNHISDKMDYSIKVDTSIGSEIKVLSPLQFSTIKEQILSIETLKEADYCSYGDSAENISINLTTTKTGAKAFKEHKSGKLIFPEGKYTYYFECKLKSADQPIGNYVTFIIDTTPPTFKSIDVPVTSASLNSLSAVFNFDDNLSGIKFYNYSIGTKPKTADILNWTSSTESKIVEKKLFLKNNTIYYWTVFATNNVGLASEQKASDGIIVNTASSDDFIIKPKVDLCKNGIKDTGETDIDCGGTCSACLNKAECAKNSDCASNICIDKVCKKATCDDGILNQGETDVDCGGNNCDSCKVGLQCQLHSDCLTKYCKSNICAQASCFDGLQNGDETAVDCGGSKCVACQEIIQQPTEDNATEQPTTETDTGLSFTSILMLILLVLIMLGTGGYYYYTKFMQPQQSTQSLQSFQSLPPLTAQQQTAGRQLPIQKRSSIIQQLSPELKKRKDDLKKKEREQLLGKFDSLSSSQSSSQSPSQSSAQSSASSQSKLQERPETKLVAKSEIKQEIKPEQKLQVKTEQKSPEKKKDPLAALASSVKGKSKNAIEELRSKVKKK